MNDKLIRFGNKNMLPLFFNQEDLNTFFEQQTLPATNITENESQYMIDIALPGFDKENINLEIHKGVLKVSANKENKFEEKNSNEKIIRREFKTSSFSRAFTLPDNVEMEGIQAEQKNGVLSIFLPKFGKDKEVKKTIEIK